MKPLLRLTLIRWLLTGALLGCAYCAAHGAVLVYFMSSSTTGITVFQPPSAEEVSRNAAPFQANTRETDGMFRLVQEQHIHLGFMFSRLETSEQMNWSLVVLGTAIFSLLCCVFVACLALLPGKSKQAHSQQVIAQPTVGEP